MPSTDHAQPRRMSTNTSNTSVDVDDRLVGAKCRAHTIAWQTSQLRTKAQKQRKKVYQEVSDGLNVATEIAFRSADPAILILSSGPLLETNGEARVYIQQEALRLRQERLPPSRPTSHALGESSSLNLTRERTASVHLDIASSQNFVMDDPSELGGSNEDNDNINTKAASMRSSSTTSEDMIQRLFDLRSSLAVTNLLTTPNLPINFESVNDIEKSGSNDSSSKRGLPIGGPALSQKAKRRTSLQRSEPYQKQRGYDSLASDPDPLGLLRNILLIMESNQGAHAYFPIQIILQFADGTRLLLSRHSVSLSNTSIRWTKVLVEDEPQLQWKNIFAQEHTEHTAGNRDDNDKETEDLTLAIETGFEIATTGADTQVDASWQDILDLLTPLKDVFYSNDPWTCLQIVRILRAKLPCVAAKVAQEYRLTHAFAAIGSLPDPDEAPQNATTPERRRITALFSHVAMHGDQFTKTKYSSESNLFEVVFVAPTSSAFLPISIARSISIVLDLYSYGHLLDLEIGLKSFFLGTLTRLDEDPRLPFSTADIGPANTSRLVPSSAMRRSSTVLSRPNSEGEGSLHSPSELGHYYDYQLEHARPLAALQLTAESGTVPGGLHKRLGGDSRQLRILIAHWQRIQKNSSATFDSLCRLVRMFGVKQYSIPLGLVLQRMWTKVPRIPLDGLISLLPQGFAVDAAIPCPLSHTLGLHPFRAAFENEISDAFFLDLKCSHRTSTATNKNRKSSRLESPKLCPACSDLSNGLLNGPRPRWQKASDIHFQKKRSMVQEAFIGLLNAQSDQNSFAFLNEVIPRFSTISGTGFIDVLVVGPVEHASGNQDKSKHPFLATIGIKSISWNHLLRIPPKLHRFLFDYLVILPCLGILQEELEETLSGLDEEDPPERWLRSIFWFDMIKNLFDGSRSASSSSLRCQELSPQAAAYGSELWLPMGFCTTPNPSLQLLNRPNVILYVRGGLSSHGDSSRARRHRQPDLHDRYHWVVHDVARKTEEKLLGTNRSSRCIDVVTTLHCSRVSRRLEEALGSSQKTSNKLTIIVIDLTIQFDEFQSEEEYIVFSDAELEGRIQPRSEGKLIIDTNENSRYIQIQTSRALDPIMSLELSNLAGVFSCQKQEGLKHSDDLAHIFIVDRKYLSSCYQRGHLIDVESADTKSNRSRGTTQLALPPSR